MDYVPDAYEKTVLYLRVPESIKNILVKDNKKVFHLPMVCEPKDYYYKNGAKKLKGYLLNDRFYTDGILKKK